MAQKIGTVGSLTARPIDTVYFQAKETFHGAPDGINRVLFHKSGPTKVARVYADRLVAAGRGKIVSGPQAPKAPKAPKDKKPNEDAGGEEVDPKALKELVIKLMKLGGKELAAAAVEAGAVDKAEAKDMKKEDLATALATFQLEQEDAGGEEEQE